MRDKYQARQEPMPVAVVCGGDPMTFLMASSEVPYGVSEYEIVGGVRGKPVDVVKAPVTGLPIPAQAEIVIEGFVAPGNECVEGSFGEWTGYYASDVRPEPVLDIKAVYYGTRSATRGSCSQSPSISATPGTPSRWVMSRPCATSALIAAATLSSTTTISMCQTSKS